MGDAGGSQALHGPGDASQNAPRHIQKRGGEYNGRQEGATTEWHTLIDTLQNTESDLMKEEETPGRAAALTGIRKAITHARAL
jgi:hypothetical protein